MPRGSLAEVAARAAISAIPVKTSPAATSRTANIPLNSRPTMPATTKQVMPVKKLMLISLRLIVELVIMMF